MSVAIVILGLSVIAGLLAGGSIRHFDRARIHWWALAPIALALQVVPAPAGRAGLAAAMLVASYLLLLAVVGVNRRVPGAAAMGIGLLLNLAVVGLNGGMPVSVDAARAAGAEGPLVIEGSKRHLMTDEDVLRLLGDVIPVPRPIGVVLSIGDVLLFAGMGWWLFAVTRGRFRENLRPPARRFQMYRGIHSPTKYRLPARYRRARATAPASAARPGSEP